MPPTDFEEKGKRTELKITNAIRQAQYNYYYEDRNAIVERKSRFGELFQLFKEVGQNEILFNMIDWRETIVSAVEMIGFDNSDKFFKDETPLNQMVTQLESMPMELQQKIVPMMMQVAQQQVQQMQMQQQMMQGQGVA